MAVNPDNEMIVRNAVYVVCQHLPPCIRLLVVAADTPPAHISLGDPFPVPKEGIGSGNHALIRCETVAVKEYTSFSEANNVEAQNFAKFNSLYTVKLYGVCYSLNALVLEYCPYGSIEACYGKPELDVVVKKLACYDLAKAMNYLHESKYIHRDLKPDNLKILC